MAYNRHHSAKSFAKYLGESCWAHPAGLVLVLSTACDEEGWLGSGDEVLDVSTVCNKSSELRNQPNLNGNERARPDSPVLYHLQVLDPEFERA